MNNNICQRCIAACIGLIASSWVIGAEVQIDGFASVVTGKTTRHKALPDIPPVPPFYSGETNRNSIFYADFANAGIYDNQLSFFPDSNMALQFMTDMGDGLSATAQVNAVGANRFDASLSWAYITYKLQPNLSLQVGQQRMPLYFYSDSLDVGYSYHWIRPPIEVYNSSLANFIGVNLLYQDVVADIPVRVQLWGGESEGFDPYIGVKQSYKNLTGLTVDAEYQWFTFQAMYGQTKYGEEGATSTVNGITLDQGLKNGVPSSMGGLALRFDYDKLFVMSEASYWRSSEPFWTDMGGVGGTHGGGWYIGTGYSIGKFTPHMTYGSILVVSDSSASIFQGYATKDQLMTNRALTVGVRWDFHPTSALKVEYYTSKDQSDDLIKLGAGETLAVNALSMGIDVVF
jgi:hypothetical protein